MKQKTGAAIQNRAVPLQACGPREPHPRQVDILLNNGMAVTCVKYNGRPLFTRVRGGSDLTFNTASDPFPLSR